MTLAAPRTPAAIERDLQRESVILAHALHRYDLPAVEDTWRRIDQLLDEMLTLRAAEPS